MDKLAGITKSVAGSQIHGGNQPSFAHSHFPGATRQERIGLIASRVIP
jgi:hypothetical protein